MRLAGPEAGEQDLDRYMSFILPEHREAADLSRLIDGTNECSVAEDRVLTASGAVRSLCCRRRPVRDDHGRPHRVVGVTVDVTDQKRLQARREKATTDPRTGLANRRGFELRANHLIRRALSTRVAFGFGMVLVDIDLFKPINDRSAIRPGMRYFGRWRPVWRGRSGPSTS